MKSVYWKINWLFYLITIFRFVVKSLPHNNRLPNLQATKIKE